MRCRHRAGVGTCLPWILVPLNIPLSEHRLYGMLAGLSLVVAGALPAHGWNARIRSAAVAAAVLVFTVLPNRTPLESPIGPVAAGSNCAQRSCPLPT